MCKGMNGNSNTMKESFFVLPAEKKSEPLPYHLWSVETSQTSFHFLIPSCNAIDVVLLWSG